MESQGRLARRRIETVPDLPCERHCIGSLRSSTPWTSSSRLRFRSTWFKEPGHVQLLLRMHRAAKPSVLVNNLKTVSSHGRSCGGISAAREPVLLPGSKAAARRWRCSAPTSRSSWSGPERPLAALHRPPSSCSGRAHCAAIGVGVARQECFIGATWSPPRAHLASHPAFCPTLPAVAEKWAPMARSGRAGDCASQGGIERR